MNKKVFEHICMIPFFLFCSGMAFWGYSEIIKSRDVIAVLFAYWFYFVGVVGVLGCVGFVFEAWRDYDDFGEGW